MTSALTRKINRRQAAELVGTMSTFSGQDSNVVELTASSSNPRFAAIAANTLAEQNIAARRLESVRRIKKSIRASERERRGALAR